MGPTRLSQLFGRPGRLGLGLALLFVLLSLSAIGEYDYFRDELYYLASTRHLDFGYVDHPPLSIWILAGWTGVLGDSLVVVRLLPALAGGLCVLLAVGICRRLGGGTFAQTVTGLAGTLCGYLAIHHYFSMNSFDLLIWVSTFWLLMNVLENPSRRAWILLGFVLGLGLLNKLSVLWLGAGILVGLLATPHRRVLKTPGPWLAGLIAAALFAPYVLWQATHGWPTLEFMANAAAGKMVSVSPAQFFAGQAFFMSPVHAPIWILGLGALLFAPAFRHWRIFGWIYLTTVAILLAAGESKSFYLGPAYPPLLAAGAITLERLLARGRWRVIQVAVLAVMIAGGILLTPIALPVLPPETMIMYSQTLGLSPRPEERHEQGALPQQYADQFGWREMAEAVARAYERLTPEERERCLIFGQNYGEAGAIDLFGRRLGLPGAVSPHNSYWYWLPEGAEPEILIIIGSSLEENLEFFDEVVQVETVRSRYAMPYENNLPIFIARGPRSSLAEAWPLLRRFS